MDKLEAIFAAFGSEQIIAQNESGLIVQCSDSYYRGIKADSKHDVEHALKTGRDYQYNVIEDHPRKPKKGMSDGSLLHTLILEESEFNNRYYLQDDFDKMHENYPLYFTSKTGVREFVSAHNAEHEFLKTAINECVLQHNAAHKEIESFVELPVNVMASAKKNKALAKKFIRDYIAKTFLLVDTDNTKSLKAELEHRIKGIIKDHSNWLSSDNPLNAHDDLVNRAVTLNEIIMEQRNAFAKLPEEEQMKVIPAGACVSEAEQRKVVKNYNNSGKIDSKLGLEAQRSALVKAGVKLDEKILNAKPQLFFKMTGITTKHDIDCVFSDMAELYGQPVVYRPYLEEEDKKNAGTREIVSRKVYEHAKRILDVLLDHPDASYYLNLKDNLTEVSMFWTDKRTGRLQKGKPDILNIPARLMADIKFVSSADFQQINREGGTFNYHLQNAQYESGYNTILPDPLEDFVFIFVEKDGDLGTETYKPIRVCVKHYPRSHIERGRELLDMSIDRIMAWEQVNHYPSFEGVTEISVPVYQVRVEEEMLREHREMKARAEANTLMAEQGVQQEQQDDVLAMFAGSNQEHMLDEVSVQLDSEPLQSKPEVEQCSSQSDDVTNRMPSASELVFSEA